MRGLSTGPTHSSAGTRQRPSSAPPHQPSPSTRPLSRLYANKPHDKCANRIPNNSFPSGDVFVNGKNFDALDVRRALPLGEVQPWERAVAPTRWPMCLAGVSTTLPVS
ncbi:DUF6310 domain-containing protein [Archangium gephyra]|uniref:DUF6310 domain-containing protein n=1 Tax=Archangium gephyra TaxID=48 RepID=UPI003B835E9A